ncbi:PKD domain-containing protein [Paucibacter sp. R3-3]|uniref:PKD domain-containing protein n=1 Tax=Roseateles agri TaxID=3098619 RepID=A0ABU5DNE9_9BURK|nr:PKD domain-containing protein [Paucibacter sp. R3-3]MDY0747258.1 PKD domain-containing protein [Paucibacter sp. R3-3]
MRVLLCSLRSIVFAAFIGSLGLVTTARAADYIATWRLVSTSNAPTWREWSAMTWVDSLNKAVLWGGAGGGAYLNDIWAFDPLAKSWTVLDPNDSCGGNTSFNRPNGSDESGVVFDPINNYFWLWNGGRGYSCESQPGFVRSAGAGTAAKNVVDPTLPATTDDFYKDWIVRNSGSGTAVVLSYNASLKTLKLDNDIGIVAGSAYSIYADFGSGTWAYDLSTGQYSKLMQRHWGYTGLAPTERRSPGFAADGINAYMFGGASDDNALFRLDFAGKNFQLAIPAGQGTSPPARGQIENQFVYDSINRRFVLFGGLCYDRNSVRCTNGDNIDDTWLYDPAVNTWTAVTAAVHPSGRNQAQMYFDSKNGVVVLFGGVSSAGTLLDDVWTFDTQTLSWTQQQVPATNPGNVSLALTTFAPSTGCGYSVYGESRGAAIFGVWELCLRLNSAPTAVISLPSGVQAGIFSSFSASSSTDAENNIASYAWDFGDGTTALGSSATKVYASAGTYTVTLTVTDSLGAVSTTSGQVVVSPAAYSPPIASFNVQPAMGSAGTAAQFSAASSSSPNGAIASYAWDFGDGTSASGISVSKIYPYLGTYKVTLTVTDNRGLSAVQSVPFAVQAPAGVATNVALAANGGVASASSVYDTRYPVAAVNNGDRRGLNWNAGGGWNDGTKGIYPDWVQIDFNGTQTISEIDVFTLQDNTASPSVPTLDMTFSTYGVTQYEVQYWDGANWVDVQGGNVTGNNKVWRQFTFPPVNTPRIRVLVSNALNNFSRIVEVEAWTPGSGANQAPVAAISGPASGLVGANLSFSGAGSTDAEGAIASYAWTFGDGTSASGVSVTKSYAAAGSYTVTLTVTDAAGLSSSKMQTVVITVAGSVAINVAASANGGVATASSVFDSNYPASAVNNGDRRGLNWGAGGAWADGTAGVYPDWVQIDFNGAQTISEIDVFTLQDNSSSPSVPTLAMTFSNYGITDFSVQYWNGAAWVAVPGGNVTGNNKVWRQFSFAPITTQRIRVQVNNSAYYLSRIAEVEAWTPGSMANQAPVAAISGPTSGQVGASLSFSGAGSTDAEGAIASYAWTFGDGTSASGVSVTKSYTAAGNYTVTLTVTDAAGLSNSKTQAVAITAPTNQAPVANISGPTSGQVGASLSFSGAGSTDAEGAIASYAWTFGDGTSASGVSVTKSYAAAGNYTVTLTVTDAAGLSNSKTQAVAITAPTNQAPVAAISGPASGLVGANLSFSGAGSTDAEGAIASYAWTFGDGTSASGVSVTKSYAAAGSYTVTLTVTDAAGLSSSKMQTVVITVAGSVAINVAASANGGVATASSVFDSNYPASAVNNGDRRGLNWGAGGAWADGTAGVYPDWVQIDFNGAQTISEIDVFTLQDNSSSPSVPTLAMTFSNYGITDFSVQYWNGAAWVAVPGGNVTGNNKVWRQFSFAPITTQRIRVQVNSSAYYLSRIVEVEAWTAPQ